MKIIDPLRLAESFNAVKNMDPAHNGMTEWLLGDRRRGHLLWFLQWWSMQPGGLEEMAKQVLARYPDRFVTKGVAKAGAPTGGHYSLAQKLTVFNTDFGGGFILFSENNRQGLKLSLHELGWPDEFEDGVEISGDMTLDELKGMPNLTS